MDPRTSRRTPEERSNLTSVPVVSGANGVQAETRQHGQHVLNLVSYNFTGLAGNEVIKFLFADAHMDLERYIADLLSTEASILYSPGFSTIPCVISAFAKRGDIIIADRGINVAIQKGLQISRSAVRWFDHSDLKSLENVLLGVE
ncbi:pyridoxal phosphate-dependent transferase [Lactarius sanguifluus]|nr:pyridoxal phosphate-dependent transferase [Lactarius sanguifluus]